MTDADDRRLEVALRLKAARYLLGSRNSKGQAVALPPSEMAQLDVLRENRVTKNRIEDIEQMRVDARPYELDLIAGALGLPALWFGGRPAEPDAVTDALGDLGQALVTDARERRQARGVAAASEDATGRRPRGTEGDVG